MYIESFRQLTVWQRSLELVKEVYGVANVLPDIERYGLASQMRRAAISIPANIAEGKKRKTRKDFLSFLRVSDGSAAELETLLVIAKDLYHGLDILKSMSLLTEVQKMLGAMIRKLESGKTSTS